MLIIYTRIGYEAGVLSLGDLNYKSVGLIIYNIKIKITNKFTDY